MFIELGILNFKLLILLINPIANIVASKILTSVSDDLYVVYINCISYLPAGVIYLIILFKSRSSNKRVISVAAERGSAIKQIEEQQKEEKKREKRKEKIFIFLLALLNFLGLLIGSIFSRNVVSEIYSTRIDLVVLFCFYIFFSKLFLYEKIYKHRAISIIIISICYLIFSICYLILLKKNEISKFEIGSFLIYLIFVFSFHGFKALFPVLVKTYLNTYLTDPYLFMFYLGLFGLIILIPFEIIYYFCFDGNSEIFGEGIIYHIISSLKYNIKNLIYIVWEIPFDILICCCDILTIYYFTPCHLMISIMLYVVMSKIAYWKNDIKKNEEINYKIISIFIVVDVISILFSLIYNEIIIIKLWSLEKNTTKYISERQKTEFDHLDQFYNDNENDELDNSVESLDSLIEFKNFDEKNKKLKKTI